MRVVVVGSGIAGLVAALELARAHQVTLVSKSRLAESNTRYAQGGIAAVMAPGDTVAEHIEDTLRAGAGLCRPEAVEILCAEGPHRVRELIALGVAFDRRNGELAQAREAAHSRARVLHAGGDATGLMIETALVAALREASVTVLEHTFAADLLLGEHGVRALEILDAEGRRQILRADAVILASGGAGHLFPYTTNPSVATGDGVALALRAGAQLADLEFYQFHPTALAAPGGFLISEAVRGDGAVLRAADGSRFMQAIHPDAELAPRDVVARGIAEQMALQPGIPVVLDATGLGGPDFLARRFPTIDAACRRAGFDWSRVSVPVAPAAHYWMGGIETDIWGRTSIPGLFAVGEVACTGVHGANRLASNSLLESLVFAWRSANLLVDGVPTALQGWTPPDQAQASTLELDTEAPSRADVLPSRSALQQLLWASAGITRNGPGLRAAQTLLSRWRVQGETVAQHEDANLLLLGRALIAAALSREESRGAHFRTDFPNASATAQQHIAVSRRVEVAC